jgi:hypothetical protein
MQEMGIRSQIRRKHRCNYSSSQRERVTENVLKRNFKAEKPNQKWVTDITQFRVAGSWLYLSAVKDLFNNEIVAYQMSHRNDNKLVLETFDKAFSNNKDVTFIAIKGSSTRPMLTTTCCQRLAPESACLAGAIVMITPRWRASSRISKRKGSIPMISEIQMKHKDESNNLSIFIINVVHKEN